MYKEHVAVLHCEGKVPKGMAKGKEKARSATM